MKDLPPLPSLCSIYPFHHAQLFSPLLVHSQQTSSSSSSFGNDSVQAITQGLEEEEEDENGYFAGLARRIVHSMLDEDEKTGAELFVEPRMIKDEDRLNCSSMLRNQSSLSLPHDIKDEVAAAISLSAKEPSSMHENLKKKKQLQKKKKKGKQGKQVQVTAMDEELSIYNSKVVNGSKGGANEGRAGHSSKRESRKDYRSSAASSMHILINRSDGGGSASGCGGTGVFLPRSYTPCTHSTALNKPSCPTTSQACLRLVSPLLEKAIVLPSPSYAARAAVESRIHDGNWKPSPPYSTFSSFCSPLEHITSDISLPMEWTY